MNKAPVVSTSIFNKFTAFSLRKKLAIIGGLLGLVAIIIPVTTYAYYAQDISNRQRLMNHNNTGIVLTDKNGEAFYSRGVIKNFKEVSLDNISDYAEKALIASEDKDFYSNPGFSPTGIARAAFSNIKGGDPTGSGGSGITQQLVKNNLLTGDKNYLRKYQEVSMAVAIERHYTKKEILEMYLNSVYFGNDAFGIEMAANNYFDKPARDLTLAESAMLVGLLPAPTAYSPTTGDAAMAKKRQEYVLSRMVEEHSITEEEKSTALAQSLSYKTPDTAEDGAAPHFALMVLDELNKKYGEERVTRSGFRVKTSLDLTWQKQAQEAVYSQTQKLAAQNARNGALVAIDPSSGEVRALVGSADWANQEYGKVNMATTPRQPGSSFKPIYYTEALNTRKITAATTLHDKPTDFGGGYRPTNYDFRYHGNVSTRYALANSLNIPAVEVMQKVGVDEASQTAQRMGITTVDKPDTYGLSLALGTAEARLTDMTNAYAAFANQGEQYPITTITSITDKFGSTVYHYKPKAHRVMGAEASFIISSILSDEKARYPLAGTKFNIGRPAAVKTGTTNDNRDAWTIGYTPQIAVGVWVGNNDNTPMRGVGGSLGAGPIWRTAMTQFLQGAKAEPFTMPSGVIQIKTCASTSSSQEYFIKGTEGPFKCTEKKDNKKDERWKPEEHDKKEDHKQREEEKKPEKPKDNNGQEPGGEGGSTGEEGGRGGEEGDGTGDTTDPPTTEEPPAPTTTDPQTIQTQ